MPATHGVPGTHDLLRLLAAGVLAGLLAACGGGGIRAGVPHLLPALPPTPPPPPPATTSAPPPPIDAQLSITHANAAHQAGYTGAGVTIGFVDSGIMPANPTVAGRVVKQYIDVDPSQNDTTVGDVVGHGTWVASIAAGMPFAKFPGGIAPGASLVSARIIADNAPNDHGQPPSPVTASEGLALAQVNQQLIGAGVQVMNNSWGGITWDTTDNSVNQAFATAYAPFVNQHDGLVVFAAGNGSDANPSTIAALPTLAPDLAEGWLTVVAVDSNHPTKLASYSNQCGVAKDYCLAAPGDVIVLDKDTTTATTDPKYWIVGGTSLAAPQVSGAAALVWQAFPYFTNDLVRQTLLGTADPLGGTQPNTTFGYGELDVGRAVQGPAQLNWGDVSVSFDGFTSTWSNDIAGNGGLIKNGTGTLVLAGTDTYTGGSQVLGGALQAVHSLPGNVTVGVGGALQTVPGVAGDLANAGKVAIGGGDTNVGGNYTQATAGTLAVSLGSKLAVTGTATLSGGTLEVAGADAGYTPSSKTDVLTAVNGVHGTFANPLVLDTGVVFMDRTIGYASNAVWLNTTGLDITQVAATLGIVDPVAASAAMRVQGSFDNLNASLAGGKQVAPDVLRGAGAIQHAATPAAARATLQSLSGQLYAARAAMLLDTVDATGHALSRHVQDLLNGQAKPGAWYGSLGWQGDLSRAGYTGATSRSNGSMAGADFMLGQRALLGYAVGASRGYGQLDASWDRSNSWANHVLVYGLVSNGPWYASAQVGNGWYRTDMQRLLWLGQLAAPVASRAAGRYLTGALESGTTWRVAGIRVSPFVNLRYQHLNLGAFAEQGGLGFGLQANRRALTRVQSGLGLRAKRGWPLANGMWMQIVGSAEWWHALGQEGDVFNASFTGFDAWLPVRGVGLSRDESVLRAGISLWPARRFALQLDVTREQGDRMQSNHAMLSGTLTF